MFNTQGTKRAAEDYSRVNHGSDSSYINSQASKKPRFDVRNPSALAPDALEEDATLDADVIGNRGQQVRRGAVNIDGYDSDSDNENFDTRAATRPKENASTKKSKDEDENDMFADLEEDFHDGDDDVGAADRREGKKKAVRFLDEDEIEGQVKNSRSGGHVSADFSLNGKAKAKDDDVESSSDSEVDDATRADHGDLDEELGAGGKKSHAPKLDAFNMRNENEEGRFDEQGNYVRKAADPDAIHDAWLEGISKKEMKKANEAHERRERERRERAIRDDAKSDADILGTLLPLLQPSETVLEALARLNKEKVRKPKWQARRKRKNISSDVMEDDKATPPREEERSKAIDTITEAADLLLARGQPEIYDIEKELLMRQYQRTSGKEWTDPSDDHPKDASPDQWQYRWSDARDGGEVHGPYDAITMKSWVDAGYFGEGVEYQRIGAGSWSRDPEFI